MTGCRVLAVCLLALAAASAGAKEVPFPVSKSVILRQGGIKYVVEGRMTIPKGVEISCQKDVYVVGKGEGATLVVEGDLAVHGVGTREVIFENLTIELAPEFEECRLDMAIFRKGARVRSAPGKAVRGQLHVELSEFYDASDLDVVFEHGSIQLRSACFDSPVKIVVKNPPDADDNQVRVTVFGCSQADEHPGLQGGLHLEGARDVLVRFSRIGGELARFENCRKLALDGVKIDAKTLEIRQDEPGLLRRTSVKKCDIYAGTVLVHSPRKDERTVDKLVLERCWFRDVIDPRRIHAEVLKDGADDPRNAARIVLGKVSKRPSEFGGMVDR